jgi:hypothetical protein
MSDTSIEALAVPAPSGNTVTLEVARLHLLRQVTDTIAEQPFTGLVGEAELGKSRILNAALRQLSSRQRAVVKLDLDGAWSPNRLAWQWALELARAAVGAVPISHLHSLDRSMWPASTRSAVLSLPGALGPETAALAQQPQPANGIGRDEALQAPLQATLALAREREVILAIDHLETPSAAGLRSPDVAKLLWSIRAPAQHLKNLHVVVATRPAAQDLASGAQSAYHLLGRWLTIQPPTAEEFAGATGMPLPWCDHVVAHTGGHPSSTMEVLAELRTLTTDRGQILPDLPTGYSEKRAASLVEYAIVTVSERHVDLARRSIEHARSVHRLGSHLLAAVARGEGPYQATPEIPGSEVAKAMVRLHLNGLVRQRGSQRGWEPTDPRIRWALSGATSLSAGLWRGLRGGVVDGPYVGAHIIDAATGRRCQVEEVLDDGATLRVRFEDGHSEVLTVRRPTEDELATIRLREIDEQVPGETDHDKSDSGTQTERPG